MENKSVNRYYKKLSTGTEENNSKVIEILHSLVSMKNMTKNDFFKEVFEGVFKLIDEAEKGSFFELSEDKYIPIFAKGYNLNILQKLDFNKSDFFIGFECPNDKDIEVYQTYVEKRDESKFTQETIQIFKELGTYSKFTILYGPIQVDGVNVGLISLECFNEAGFSEDSMKVLKLYTKFISDFYSHNINQSKQAKLYDEIIAALVTSIEVKDKYTMGHAQRVKKYSQAIAEELNLPQSQVMNISIAALLHDIGKIGIPENILNKPGRLTEEEYNIIKLHPVYTKEILQNVNEFSNIADFAFKHHENFDGTGYPQGLKSDEIPIESQVIQIADAFDAMTSERAYRKAFSTDEAIKIIEKEMGKQFNPQIAKVAVNYFKLNGELE